MIKLGKLQTWLDGAQLFGNPEAIVERIHTDTRTIQQGDLFVALSGEQFDGNAFIAEAIAKGAVAVMGQYRVKLCSGSCVSFLTQYKFVFLIPRQLPEA